MSSNAKILGMRNSIAQNKKVLETVAKENDFYKKMREGIKRKHGLDITNADSFPVNKDGFSFKAMESKLMEADASTSFTPLLRAGVQTIMNDQYQLVPTTFEEWTHVVSSDKDEELYAPLHGIGFPGEVGRGEKYPESGALGLDIKLKNRKYGELYPVEMELLMNDQTGQVKNMVGIMAEYAKIVIEVIVYAKLASVASMNYSGLSIPVSETQPASESTYPWSSALVGGGSTLLSGGVAAFTAANFQKARNQLRAQKNLLGIKMAVKPNRIITSPHFELDVSTILNSAFYPSGAQSAGVTGGAFAQNFLKGIAQHTCADYLFDNTGVISGDSKAWFVLDDTKPAFVVQMREPASVVQENPEAGEAFERDISRHKMRIQANADFIDPRFFLQGSDGSV